jgi:archaellum component FlaG (FlaF/FlaG flagellin family)
MILVFSAVAIFAVTAGWLTYASTRATQNVPSKGKLTVLNVGVYLNSGCTQSASALDWGTLTVGGNATLVVWVKNAGSGNVTLSLTTGSWVPSAASSWMTLSWNQEGTFLIPQQVVQATLVLTVSSFVDGDVGDFAFNIIIAGAG